MKDKIVPKLKVFLFVIIPVLVVVFAYRAAGMRRVNQFLADTADPALYTAAVDLINRTLVNFDFNYFHYQARHPHARPAAGGDIAAFSANGDGHAVLARGEALDLRVTVPETGLYNIYVNYRIPGETLLPVTVSLYINGQLPFRESRTLDLPFIFKDEHKNYELDRFGDEMLPPQIRVRDWRGQQLFDSNYVSLMPLEYYLEAGEHEISLRNIVRSDVWIRDVIFKPARVLPTHEEYIAQMVAQHGVPYEAGEPFMQALTANEYAFTVSSDIAVRSWNDPSFARFSNRSLLINFAFYHLFGSEVAFEFTVPRAGFYSVAFHYGNPYVEASHFHNIMVNGEIPSASFAAVEATATGMNLGNLEILDDNGKPLRVFLHEGSNIISIKGVRGPYASVIDDLQTLLLHISEFILDVRKITGAEVDTNRTWRLTRYLPNTVPFLEAYQVILEESIRRIEPYMASGIHSDVIASLIDAVSHIRFMLVFPDELPLHLELLAGEAGSVMDYISHALNFIMYQNMVFSQVFVYNDYPLPRANLSFPRRVASITEQIWLSFVSDRYRVVPDPEILNVWVNLSPMHINTLQSMIDGDFTRRTGIDVRVSLIPDLNRLVLANAAGETPDIAMGLSAGGAFNLSSRNALHDLSLQPDFWQVASRFPPGSLVSYIFNEGVFAVPDQINFNALVYRTDVFNSLGLAVPDT